MVGQQVYRYKGSHMCYGMTQGGCNVAAFKYWNYR
jgi:hypothetical protein